MSIKPRRPLQPQRKDQRYDQSQSHKTAYREGLKALREAEVRENLRIWVYNTAMRAQYIVSQSDVSMGRMQSVCSTGLHLELNGTVLHRNELIWLKAGS